MSTCVTYVWCLPAPLTAWKHGWKSLYSRVYGLTYYYWNGRRLFVIREQRVLPPGY